MREGADGTGRLIVTRVPGRIGVAMLAGSLTHPIRMVMPRFMPCRIARERPGQHDQQAAQQSQSAGGRIPE